MISSLGCCQESNRYFLDILHERDRVFDKQLNSTDLVFIVKVFHRTNGYDELIKIPGRSHLDG